MKGKKGFTLVELLVVMVILGIVVGLSFPAIRVLQEKNADRKYNAYRDSLKASAKLYLDSYEDDLFGRKESGCACIKYEELESKKLTKDIAIKDMTCDTDNTFVRVNKAGGNYTYDSYIGCRDRGENKISVVYPKQKQPHTMASAGCDTMCNDEVTNGIYVYAYPESGYSYSKKHYSTVNIHSVTGINQGVEIYYAWSTDPENSESLNNYKRVRITVPSNQKETMESEWNEDHSITATSAKINTPAGKTGTYYLHVRVDRLYDLYDSAWQQGDGGKYLVFGPFNIDNEPPRLDYSFESSNDTYNSLTPKLNLDVEDNITSKNRLKICVSVKKSSYYYNIFYTGTSTTYTRGTTSGCIPSRATSSTYRSYVYKNFYTPVALTTMDAYGTSYPTYFSVIDEAYNHTYVDTTYTTSRRYTITYNSNGGNNCSPTSKNVIIKNSGKTTWGTLCEPTKENYVFDGWYTTKTGTTKVTEDSEVTKSLTVYAHWKPQKYTVTVVKGEGISNATLKGTSTLTQQLDYGSTYTINVTGVSDYYHFTKWVDEDNTSISTTKSKSLTVTGDITLTAIAVKNGISIHYYSNNGTLAPKSRLICPQAINCGSACNNTTNESGCTGNSTGLVYKSAYGKFDSAGLSSAGIRDHAGEDGTLPMERYGYEPTVNWHIDSATSTKLINENTKYDTIKDFAIAVGKDTALKTGDTEVALYAGWNKIIYKVSLNKKGGTGGTATVYEYYGKGWYSNSDASTSISSVETPKKLGYKFLGYYTEETGGVQIINASGNFVSGKTKTFTGEGTLYAHYRATRAYIYFTTEGGTIRAQTEWTVPTHSDGSAAPVGEKYYWQKKNSVTINGGTYNDVIYQKTDNTDSYALYYFIMNYNEVVGIGGDGLPDYNNTDFIYITKSGKVGKTEAQWKCLSNNCVKSAYNQYTGNYGAQDFCSANYNDCTVVLGVNWVNE